MKSTQNKLRGADDMNSLLRLSRPALLCRSLVAALGCLIISMNPLDGFASAHHAPISTPSSVATSTQELVGTDGWIGYPGVGETERPVVLHFRRLFALTAKPRSFKVRVSADTNFVLWVNGRRVAAGPSTADLAHWRYTSADLAPYLHVGRNAVVATVWNFVRPPPSLPATASEAERRDAAGAEFLKQPGRLAQQSKAVGFWLAADGRAKAIGTNVAGWEVTRDVGRAASPGIGQLERFDYYVAGAGESIDLRRSVVANEAALLPGPDWVDAVAAPGAARQLLADPLPQQHFDLVPTGSVVRTNVSNGEAFPKHPVTIAAHSHATLLLRRDAMVSGYPELLLSGGRDAKIRLTYAEALYDDKHRKGDRLAVDGHHISGIHDDIVADGTARSVMPLWWRTWMFLQVDVETADASLTLTGMRTWETGYPFVEHGYFHSSDPELDRIWQVGWRTALVDAHDTYMDSSYWEQLQYVGDTRLQMLISYAVSGDNRLAAQAIDAFAQSRVDGGLVEGAWPSRGTNAIAPFSLLWVGMLHDWWREQPDTAIVRRNLPRMREVLRWFAAWQAADGLLRKNPQWNFVDWVGQSAGDRSTFPSYGKNGEGCLTTMLYLGAVAQAGDLEQALGDPSEAKADRDRAILLRTALRQRCYAAQHGLYADNPDLAVFSQQMNALAVLYDVATPGEAPALLDRIVAPDKGIDAPAGMFTSSYYFAWYLARAYDHVSLGAHYQSLLVTWRDLLKLNFTTWPEERGNTRSDTHAWSAHPTADLLRVVAGIGPGEAGYRSVRIAPSLGGLSRLDAAAMTPSGLISVRYRIRGATLDAVITKPVALRGWFEMGGKHVALPAGRARLHVAAPTMITRVRTH